MNKGGVFVQAVEDCIGDNVLTDEQDKSVKTKWFEIFKSAAQCVCLISVCDNIARFILAPFFGEVDALAEESGFEFLTETIGVFALEL